MAVFFSSRSEKQATVFVSDEVNHRCLGDPFLIGSNWVLQLTVCSYYTGYLLRRCENDTG